jgi:hypothetical protein
MFRASKRRPDAVNSGAFHRTEVQQRPMILIKRKESASIACDAAKNVFRKCVPNLFFSTILVIVGIFLRLMISD